VGDWWKYLLIAAAIILFISIFFYLTCHLYKRCRCHCDDHKSRCRDCRCCPCSGDDVRRCWASKCCRCHLMKLLRQRTRRSARDWQLSSDELVLALFTLYLTIEVCLFVIIYDYFEIRFVIKIHHRSPSIHTLVAL